MSHDLHTAAPEANSSDRPGIAPKRRIPAILAASGAASSLLGIFFGRGMEQGMSVILARLFLLVIGFSVFLVGIVGLAAQATRKQGKGT